MSCKATGSFTLEKVNTMKLKIHNEPNQVQSKFLTHNLTRDRHMQYKLASLSAEEMPQLSYLRLEVVRLRAGMSDFIVRLSTPKLPNQVKSNTIVTLRASKAHGAIKGVREIAQTIASEMEKREDSTHAWEKINLDHLTRMLFPYFKFFATNTALENMQFTTEALM